MIHSSSMIVALFPMIFPSTMAILNSYVGSPEGNPSPVSSRANRSTTGTVSPLAPKPPKTWELKANGGNLQQLTGYPLVN